MIRILCAFSYIQAKIKYCAKIFRIFQYKIEKNEKLMDLKAYRL